MSGIILKFCITVQEAKLQLGRETHQGRVQTRAVRRKRRVESSVLAEGGLQGGEEGEGKAG